jgi:hypothetical protein
MSDEPRKIFVGHLPTGGVTYVADGESDPVARLIADAEAKLDAERAEEARALAAKVADAKRLGDTKRARARRRVEKALKVLARMIR